MLKAERELILEGLYYIRGGAESEASRIELHLKSEGRGPTNKWSRAARSRAARAGKLIERVRSGNL